MQERKHKQTVEFPPPLPLIRAIVSRKSDQCSAQAHGSCQPCLALQLFKIEREKVGVTRWQDLTGWTIRVQCCAVCHGVEFEICVGGYLKFEKLEKMSFATTRSRLQDDPKETGLRPRG